MGRIAFSEDIRSVACKEQSRNIRQHRWINHNNVERSIKTTGQDGDA